jgi:hypothetical protein
MREVSKKFLSLTLAIASLVSFTPSVLAEDIPSGVTVGPPVVEYTMEKGTTLTGTVRVNDYAPVPVTLYPQVQDFEAKNESGEPAFVEPDPNRKFSLSSWIKFSPDPLKLAVGQLEAVPYQIVVPADAEPGGHYGVIFFSTKAPNDVKEGEAKIGASMKVGQLILVRVAGETKEQGAVASFKTNLLNLLPKVKTQKYDGLIQAVRNGDFNFVLDWKVPFVTRIGNSGNVHFKPQGKIEVKNVLGQKKAELTVNEVKGNVLPDSTRRWDNNWEPKWYNIGLYKAALDLKYGDGNQTLADSQWFLVIPWWLILVILVIVVWLLVRRFRKKRKQ